MDLNKLKMDLGFGCEFSKKCEYYRKDSYTCRTTPVMPDGRSYCGKHAELSDA